MKQEKNTGLLVYNQYLRRKRIALVAAMLYFLFNRWNYNAMESGADTAKSLGVNTRAVMLVSMGICSLLAAVAVLLGRENRILIAAALAASIIVNAIAVALSRMQREA